VIPVILNVWLLLAAVRAVVVNEAAPAAFATIPVAV
jgi:hypothetical protein